MRSGRTLPDALDADVSGRDFEQGKPYPEIFLTAAEGSASRQGVLRGRGRGEGVQPAGTMAALGLARAKGAEFLAGANARVRL